MMLDKGPILVPLDGSELAEGALAYAIAVAKALHERIVLVTAWEGTEADLGATFPSMAVEIEQKASTYYGEYLDGIRKRVAAAGVLAEPRVVSGDAAEQILVAARETGARMIALSTHGRSGIGRWFYGSVASRLLRESLVPVLAAGPHALERAKAGEIAIKHIMVPLDGSELGEAALPVARSLAKAMGAKVTLVRAVSWALQSYPYALPDAYIPQVDDELQKGAEVYLRKQEAAMSGTDVDAFVVRGPIASALLDVAEKQAVDLIIMTTHARGGLARAALGSTADRMLQAIAPVLLVRPESA
jgi:nucleotide-binding universal stress UspA family protein